MKITFVGTGSGSTSLKRYHSSLLISSSSYKMLVDAGDGISRALLSSNIPYNIIDGILITHFHPDHFTGLPGLLVQMKMAKKETPLDIYVHASKAGFLEDFLFNSYILQDRYDFNIRIKSIDTFFDIKPADDLSFVVQENSHIDKYRESVLSRNLSLVSLSVLFSVDGRKIFYTGDIGDKADLELFNRYDYLITESTHVTYEEIVTGILNKEAKVYLTHINDSDEEELQNKIKPAHNPSIVLATDGLVIEEK